ncbi:MAG: hypothetical protein HZR80_02790 [Candidatus Heimdallarchaeota archaeon]
MIRGKPSSEKDQSKIVIQFFSFIVIILLLQPFFMPIITGQNNKVEKNPTINNPISIYHSWKNLAAKKRIAFQSNSNGFNVLNLTDPKNPTNITEHYIAMDLQSHYITINNTLLYLSVSNKNNWSLGFVIFDVSDLQNIRILNQFSTNRNMTWYYTSGIQVKGRYVYNLINNYEDEIGGVLIVDCKDPNNPIEVGSYFYNGYNFDDFVIRKQHLYLMKFPEFGNLFDGRIQIIDISNHTTPQKVGEINEEGYINAIECQNDYLFLIKQNKGLKIFNISDPTSPQEKIVYNAPEEYFKDITLNGTNAYIAKNDGLAVLDISIIDKPKMIGKLKYDNERGPFREIIVEDGLAYLFKDSENINRMLFIIDVSDPAKPKRMFPTWIGPDWVRDITFLFVFLPITLTCIVIFVIITVVIVTIKKSKKRNKIRELILKSN